MTLSLTRSRLCIELYLISAPRCSRRWRHGTSSRKGCSVLDLDLKFLAQQSTPGRYRHSELIAPDALVPGPRDRVLECPIRVCFIGQGKNERDRGIRELLDHEIDLHTPLIPRGRPPEHGGEFHGRFIIPHPVLIAA